MEIYSDNEKELICTEYGEVGSDERKIVNEKEKTVTICKGDISKILNKEENIKFDRFSLEERKSAVSYTHLDVYKRQR